MGYRFRTGAIALAALLAATASASAGGDYSNSSSYNTPYGMTPGSENQTIQPSLRDGNGNLQVVNGQFTTANFGTVAGASVMTNGVGSGFGSSVSGVGTNGAPGTVGTATAIGNQLNVVTLGNNNTVVVNSVQTNTGNQSATNSIGH